MKRITITAGDITCPGELADTPCAQAIWAVLPFSRRLQTWGDEIYFPIPVNHGLDSTARELVGSGNLGYWPEGPAFCIFFGPTPISKENEIRAASPVNIIGKIMGDPTVFRTVPPGTMIIVTKQGDE
ncbi:MAG: hypothetical protein JXD19_02410 [Deltaproteobacteria bacterium]|nr:hypothetical protein [Deltaproteobacteria bacterium]